MELRPLLHSHPYWDYFRSMIERGVEYKLEDISEEQRIKDMEQAMHRGNHKSAQDQQELLETLVQDDISAGFQLPILVEAFHNIPHAVVFPYDITHQSAINKIGERIPKDRLTHDQSFDFLDGNSVNHRLLVEDEFHELRYGSCLLQLMHYAHALRFNQPSKKNVCSKIDLKSAYRRNYLGGKLGAMAITIVGYFALMSLRLPFGGTYCVHVWCVISEFICDVTNALLRCKHWDPGHIDFQVKCHVPKPKPQNPMAV